MAERLEGRRSRTVRLPPVGNEGLLTIPERARGLVIFAHGESSGRTSPRNATVAEELRQAGYATLLLDLLTEHERSQPDTAWDVNLFALRLTEAVLWAQGEDMVRNLPIGLYGGSIGAAAAVITAAQDNAEVTAIVCRGGRIDRAGDALAKVTAPTLLVVGSEDKEVLDINRKSQTKLRCENELSVITSGGHLFDEPGTLARVSALARRWFDLHLAAPGSGSGEPLRGFGQGMGEAIGDPMGELGRKG